MKLIELWGGNMSKYKVIQHGSMHVDKGRPIFCPECACELNKNSTETTSETDECLFGTLRINRMYETIKCDQCGCMMQRKARTFFTSTWKMQHVIWIIISTLIVILSAAFLIYGVKTDPDCNSWVGGVAVISFFTALFFIIVAVYHICVLAFFGKE